MRKVTQLFDSLDYAMISWTACHDDECSIYRSEKENRLWYPSASSGPPASLPLLVNKSDTGSSADAIFTPKTAPSKVDPMEDTYGLSKLQIEEREVLVEN